MKNHSNIFNEKQFDNIINMIDDINNNITCVVDLIEKYLLKDFFN
jgi:hypothetical protein